MQPDAATAPSPLVLNKSEAGIAGRGVSQNLGMADPLAGSPATVASGSAQRAKATQNLAAGPALAPQEPSLVRSGIAGQARPSAVLKATPLSPSSVPGSSQPADVNANASAAMAQAASNADRGNVTASKGSLGVDTGPTTLVAEAGAGRASGGGQPQLNSGSEREMVPRALPGSAPLPSLLADAVGPAPAAPEAVGGGQPSPADVEVSSNSVVTARPGPAAESFGGPQALGSGPAAVPSLSSTHAARRDYDAADELIQPESAKGVAHLARKAARDGQLPLDPGAADLSVGNASDHNDDAVPAQSIAANAAASTSEKQASSGAAATLNQQLAAPVGQGSADSMQIAELAARAEAVDAGPGPPLAGGGTSSPPRTPRGPSVVAGAVAETVEVAGALQSSGHPDAQPAQYAGPGDHRVGQWPGRSAHQRTDGWQSIRHDGRRTALRRGARCRHEPS